MGRRVLVPTEGDVGWYVDDEWEAVWRGTVIDYGAVRPHEGPQH